MTLVELLRRSLAQCSWDSKEQPSPQTVLVHEHVTSLQRAQIKQLPQVSPLRSVQYFAILFLKSNLVTVPDLSQLPAAQVDHDGFVKHGAHRQV